MRIVFGPPGTGKTSFLINKVEQELSSGTPPDRIAFVSFTTAAVEEARARARARFGLTERDLPHFRTLHSMAFNALGLSRNSVLGDYEEFSRDTGLRIRHASGIEAVFSEAGADDILIHAHQLVQATELPFETVARRYQLPVSCNRYEAFVEKLSAWKREHNKLEYADLLSEFVRQNAPIGAEAVFIDEAQDLTAQQWRVVRCAFEGARDMWVAGDDDQAIYQWAGAQSGMMLELAAAGEPMVLEQSHRLPHCIKTLADGISGRIRKRQEKRWRSTKAQGSVLHSNSMPDDSNLREGSWMMLGRTAYALRPFCDWLEARGIPYRLNGEPVLNAQEVESYRCMVALRAGESVPAPVVKRMLLRGHWTQQRLLLRAGDRINKEALDPHTLLDERALLANIPARRLHHMRRIALRGSWDCNVDVSTIHQAKGAEADHVVLATTLSRATHRALLSPAYADDEHRVWYVGATRARRSLRIVKAPGEYAYNARPGG